MPKSPVTSPEKRRQEISTKEHVRRDRGSSVMFPFVQVAHYYSLQKRIICISTLYRLDIAVGTEMPAGLKRIPRPTVSVQISTPRVKCPQAYRRLVNRDHPQVASLFADLESSHSHESSCSKQRKNSKEYRRMEVLQETATREGSIFVD